DTDGSQANEGDRRTVRATVDIDGLDAAWLKVQALHGPIDSEGAFIGDPAAVDLSPMGDGIWQADYVVGDAGPYGLTVRAMPSHPHLVSPVEMGVVAWAE
ncbi:MAG: alpha-glucan family phosphorylase, partial [Actinomycetota bacterium]